MASKLLRGTFILSAAIFISKFLGLIFIIPLRGILGDAGIALYAYAYVPYAVILNISLLGLPIAVSKFIAKYQAMGDHETGRRLLRSGLAVMAATGVLSFLFLYMIAPWLAPSMITPGNAWGHTTADVVHVIRIVSIALLIVPMMSLVRGYFQGYQFMKPTAVSQVVEQIVRIGFILISTSMVLYVFGGQVTTAVDFAVFAAFVGGMAGFAILVRYWYVHKNAFTDSLSVQTTSQTRLRDMYKELFAYAFPFIIIGLEIPLYQLVDTMTINQSLVAAGYSHKEAVEVFTNISQYSHKLLMIPVSLSTGLTIALIPTITDSFTTGKMKQMHGQISQAFQMIFFLTIPAAVGLFVLAYPIYGTVYGALHHVSPDDVALGGMILRWYAPTAIFFALFAMTASILQGVNRQKLAIFHLLIGFLIKLALNSWFITMFHEFGAIIATDIGFIISVGLNIAAIRYYAAYPLTFIGKRTLLIFVFSLIMGIVVSLVTMIIGDLNQPSAHFITSLLTTVVGVLVGMAVYYWLTVRSGLAELIFGDRFAFLRKNK